MDGIPVWLGDDMGVYESIGQLDKAMKMLLGQWREAQALWNDAMSEKFEQEHLQMLQMDLKRAVAATDHIGKVMATVYRDCDCD